MNLNLSLSLIDGFIIFAVCTIAEVFKPLCFRVKFIKINYPYMVMFMTCGLTVIYTLLSHGVLMDGIIKGVVFGGIACWCYDAIISKLKGFIK